MQTYANAVAAAVEVPVAPLMLDAVASSPRRRRHGRPVVARGARPVLREVGQPVGPSAAELEAVREAMADPRTAGERALDVVVDRLLRDLAV